MRYESEQIAEIMTLPALASALSDGMAVLSAANIARPLNNYSETVQPLPGRLMDADGYTEAFLNHRLTTAKRLADTAVWAHPSAYGDCLLYVQRRIWAEKVRTQDFVSPAAALMGTLVALQKDYRAATHEAVNHAAKHNEDVKLLAKDIRDAVDDVVRLRMEDTTKRLAGYLLTEFPALQAKLLESASLRLEHGTND